MTADATLDFDLAPLVHRPVDARKPLAERFADFHADNPHVADALERLAAQWFAAGNQRGSTKAFIERLRWESGIKTSGAEYRLDNSLTAFYSRLLLDRHPEWSDRILLRTQKAAPFSTRHCPRCDDADWGADCWCAP